MNHHDSTHKVLSDEFEACDDWLVPALYNLFVENFRMIVQENVTFSPACTMKGASLEYGSTHIEVMQLYRSYVPVKYAFDQCLGGMFVSQSCKSLFASFTFSIAFSKA